MDIRKLVAEGQTEEIERQLLDLDSEFHFKCRKCGKCCKHQLEEADFWFIRYI